MSADKLERFEREVKLLAPWFLPEENKLFNSLKGLFADNLYKMSELSVSPLCESLGIMFKGKDDKYIADLITFMSQAGVSKKQITHFTTLNKQFPQVNILFKVDFSPEEKIKVSFYHQCLIQTLVSESIMKGLNIKKSSIDYFSDVISFLLRKKNLYIGFNYRPEGRNVLKTFFPNSIGESKSFFCPGISAIMAKLDLSSKLISLFIDFHNYIVPSEPQRNIFTSVVFTDKLEQLIKVDYEGVHMDKVAQIYKSTGISSDETDKLYSCCKELNTDKITYFGIKYMNNKPPVFKCYFTRRYALEDDPSLIGELIEETKWV